MTYRKSLDFKYTQNFFMPYEIATKSIINALRNNQNQKTNKQLKHIEENQINEQISKMEHLRITGREMFMKNNDRIRVKSNSTKIKNIKIFLDSGDSNPEINIRKKNKLMYLQQLTTKQKLNSKTPRQILSFSKGKTQSFEYTNKNKKLIPIKNEEQNNMQYYENLIVQNPLLYKKIMKIYKQQKKQLNGQNKIKIKKIYNKNELEENELKFNKKTSRILDNNILNKVQNKRINSIIQYYQFLKTINLTNRIIINNQSQITYKAYICKGNNGALVKRILKTRPWWIVKTRQQISSCNIVWTEWKRNKIQNNLISKQKYQIQKNKSSQFKRKQLNSLKSKKQYEFKKLVSENDECWSLLDKTYKNQNYLSTSNKINSKIIQKLKNNNSIFQIQANYQKNAKMMNHLPGCLNLHSKKLLFLNLRQYYKIENKNIFSILPLTFHIKHGSSDQEFINFTKIFDQYSKKGKSKMKNIWICKPGQNSNRGNGINVLNNYGEIKSLVDQKCVNGRSVIIQKYFQNPFLYNKRKFDIRCYLLLTTVNGIIKAYWYQQGYIRTSSKQFSLKNLQNKFIHLTNDAIQKKGDDYGKFQNFNKLTYLQFQKYLQINYPDQKLSFAQTLSKMKTITTDLVYSTVMKLNPQKKQYSFQIYGLDFMLDDKLDPFLIEANSNPCLEVDGNVLAKVIPSMVENAIKIAIDPIFPPPSNPDLIKNKYIVTNPFQSNKFTIIYDSLEDDRTQLNSINEQNKLLQLQQFPQQQQQLQ